MAKNQRTPAQREAECLRALELHSQGFTERAIAERMTAEGRAENPEYVIVQGTVHKRIVEALERYVRPATKEARNQELARLDAYLAVLAPAIEKGDTKAIAEAIKIGDRRSKLLGLDAPQRSEVAVETTEAESALAARIAAAKAAQRDLDTIERYANKGA